MTAYKEIISSKVVIVLLAALLIFLSFLKVRQYRTQTAIEEEKQRLVEQEKALLQKSNELGQSLSYINSENFREKFAREQLNLKKEGETVYAFSEKHDTPENGLQLRNQNKPNYQKWINFFTD